MHVTTLTLAFLTGLPSAIAATPYSTWMASSSLARKAAVDRRYVSSVLLEGIQKAAILHPNSTLLTHASNSISSLVDSAGTVTGWNPTAYSLDDLRVGNNILYFWNAGGRNNTSKYVNAVKSLRSQLDHYPRTPTGGFWHRDPVYKNQMWLDGLYMAQPFYATYTSYFDASNTTAWNDIALQFDLIEQHCRNKTSGLLVHGYDESKTAVWADSITGASPHVWDRAVGWYFMALVEVLQVYPKESANYAKLQGYLKTLAVALAKTQDTAGGWWLVMDDPYPGKAGNYIESSGTAMFTYGFLKGVRTGLLDAKYRTTAEKAYKLMLSKFVKTESDGTISWQGTVEVGSLNSNGSYEYYIGVPLSPNDGKGVGPFISASVEYETWKET
ncbi:glycoside hydrolase family 105 protein [Amniculicola lignicola CBS 123094]|uniref:Glycoside hydrolase family 105 protein n=1 Tax=Amniculicola lignicola CBS 123094 TaxID=1392246 RepID=A0A6A5W635_9PLEO|nr:glycoside hydrolase family 105 protein [Amniculicola lignicola CBS 123094]